MAIDVKLQDKLEEMDRIYGGDEMYKMYGPALLTWPPATDATRLNMFTSQLKQCLTLQEPDIPRLSTSWENIIGKHNASYKELEEGWEVKQIIPKFKIDGISIKDQIYTLVLYHKEKDLYDIIEKPVAEHLTEKFGFAYNTDAMDRLEVGDTVTDRVLYKSTSYDKHMNYRYGKNANVMYSTSTDSLEDAIPVRRGWAESVTSVSPDEIIITINDNDVMVNIYGTGNEYKVIPDIGETVYDSMICALRRINKNHMLHDFQKGNLSKVNENDIDYYTIKDSRIYDVDVYYNGDGEFPTNIFHKQLSKYYYSNQAYAQGILDATNMIKQSGSNYTKNVSYARAKYLHYNDNAYTWKNKDRAFNHIVLVLKTKAIIPLDLGAKLSGRYGNKGVISRISSPLLEEDDYTIGDVITDMVDDGTMTEEERTNVKNKVVLVEDDRMPYYLRNGTRVYADIILNSSGPVRRLNPMQTTETEVNFTATQIQYLVIDEPSIPKKMDIIFKFFKLVNIEMYDFYMEKCKDKKFKSAFIKSIEEDGFYLVREPHKPFVYDDVVAIYKAFPTVRPVDIYIDLFGIRDRKTARKGIIGSQYIMILKQNSYKNFSARSTYRINRSELPTKDITKKTNRSPYSRTPLMLSEIYNILASVSGRTLAEYNLFMRSSALGRKSLEQIIDTDNNPLDIIQLEVKETFSNINAMIFASRMKGIGLEVQMSPFSDEDMTVAGNISMVPIHHGKYIIYDYPTRRKMYHHLFNRFEAELAKGIYIEKYPLQRHDICWAVVFTDPEITKLYDLSDEVKNLLVAATKGRVVDNSKTSDDKSDIEETLEDEIQIKRRRGRRNKIVEPELDEDVDIAEESSTIDDDSDDIDIG